MGSRRPQEGRRNQMQNKHERFWEEAQPQVGVWAAWAVYGGTEPQVSLSRGGPLLTPPPAYPPNSSRMLYSPGVQAAESAKHLDSLPCGRNETGHLLPVTRAS